ncbi:MAG: phosphatidylserine decarboxylase family protein [Verrucomicrobia bacterium]|nr:phosphatidylserine decarboxylase family protein [Verrucomicrobiota bacterium]
MKHKGKARRSALRLIVGALAVLVALIVGGIIATFVGSLVVTLATALLGVWVVFTLFTLYFFRDPEPLVPSASTAIVAPAHGKVDCIDQVEEPLFLGGTCQRISIFLSVFDVHVQHAPVAGRVACLEHRDGQFLNAMKLESAEHNENLLIGLDSSEQPGEKVAVRLIAGLLARRIVPWIALGDTVARGERTSLIQFGSRVDLYLPLTAKVQVRLNDKVKGGQTVVALRG